MTLLTGQIVDVHAGHIFPGRVSLEGGRIAAIEPADNAPDTYLLPGFVDAHVHIESSLLPPAEFARLALAHGTVATVSDPHEIANVLGAAGVRYMQASAAQTPLKVCFGAPSCVPATRFDRAGAILTPAEVAALLDDPAIGYLSEMMNFPGVLHDDADVLAKIAAARQRGKPVDGHAPGLRGVALRKYARAGITTDHESRALDEGREKLQVGMKLLIREGTAARDFEALHPLLDEFPHACMFCTDDKHPNDLVEGHINQLVARAVAHGHDLFTALRTACVHPVRHYGLDVGLLRVGDRADLVEVHDLRAFRVRRVWIEGQLVVEGGQVLLGYVPPAIVNQFVTEERQPGEFALPSPAPPPRGACLRIIEALDGQLVTREAYVEPKIEQNAVVADVERDVLKIVLVDRYRGGTPARAFVRNFGLRAGAIASSVAHDSHNIVAVGASDEELCRAVNLVIRAAGGLAVAGPEGDEVLPLPIAGLMSADEGHVVARRYAQLDAAAKRLGSPLAAPFMTLSFMALLVIPALKIGPEGLFDVGRFDYVPPWG